MSNEVKLMMKRKKMPSSGKSVRIIFLGLLSLAVLIVGLLHGKDLVLFNPKGQIAQNQAHLMLFSITVLVAVAIPTLSLMYFFAWKYRESNSKAKHDPNRTLGKLSVVGLWVIPIMVLILLASVVLPATYRLDPHKAIVSDTKPLTIQVIALRWKWLFIYPDQNIATVNYLQIPINTPVQFELTADEAPMNSFWIPHLGGQLYAMTGHSNLLNLIADTPGIYAGQAAEINGPGFSGMKFVARASSDKDFNTWVKTVKWSSNTLDLAEYNKLVLPSQNNPVTLYSAVKPSIYDTVLLKYEGAHNHQTEQK
ncbi:MAG: COX aromatic rich motif-containing protein [Candidatus Saccharibacteria bacterium]